MNVILLSGGSGKRLWPLSNDVRSKQFIKVVSEGSEKISLLQRSYRSIKRVASHILLTAPSSQTSIIKSQLDNDIDISVEPCRKDTFPALVLSCAYMHDINRISADEVVLVCPVDQYAGSDYYDNLNKVYSEAETADCNIVLMGVKPSYPSETHGYIIPEDDSSVSKVAYFKEKPDKLAAEDFIARGALWNCGVFAFKIGYLLDTAKKQFGTSDYKELFDKYAELPDISFDHAVIEKENDLRVFRFDGEWQDIGNWKIISDVMGDNHIGNVLLDKSCKSVNVLNELSIPLVTLGLKNTVVVATPDGILVSDKEKSASLKELVKDIKNRPMYEERSWGTYKVLDYVSHADKQNSLTKHLVIKPGKYISYQRHKRRDEIWTVIEGTGKIVENGVVRDVRRGDTAYIRRGTMHAVYGVSELHIIEVQIGDELVEEDIERFDWDWTK